MRERIVFLVDRSYSLSDTAWLIGRCLHGDRPGRVRQMPKSKARSTLSRSNVAIHQMVNTDDCVASEGRPLTQCLNKVQRWIAW